MSGSIGLLLTRLNAAAQELEPISAGSPSAEQPLQAAARRNDQLLLLVSYATTSQSIALTFRVYDVAAARQVGQASQSGRIDLSLDELVAQTFASALRGLNVRPAPAPAPETATPTGTTTAASTSAAGTQGGSTTTGTTAAASTQAGTGAATSPQGGGTGASTGGSATIGQTGESATTTPPGGGQAAGAANPAGTAGQAQVLPGAGTTGTAAAGPAAPARRKVPLVGIASGAAAFLPMSPGDPSFGLGLLATLGVNLRFALGPGTLAAGILTGYGGVQAAGAVAQAQVVLVPVGVDARYTLNDGGFPGIAFHLSGGPSIMNISGTYAGSLTKVIPYLIGGMTLDLPFAPFLGMSIEAAWASFFESPALTIMGFAPEVSLYVRF